MAPQWALERGANPVEVTHNVCSAAVMALERDAMIGGASRCSDTRDGVRGQEIRRALQLLAACVQRAREKRTEVMENGATKTVETHMYTDAQPRVETLLEKVVDKKGGCVGWRVWLLTHDPSFNFGAQILRLLNEQVELRRKKGPPKKLCSHELYKMMTNVEQVAACFDAVVGRQELSSKMNQVNNWTVTLENKRNPAHPATFFSVDRAMNTPDACSQQNWKNNYLGARRAEEGGGGGGSGSESRDASRSRSRSRSQSRGLHLNPYEQAGGGGGDPEDGVGFSVRFPRPELVWRIQWSGFTPGNLMEMQFPDSSLSLLPPGLKNMRALYAALTEISAMAADDGPPIPPSRATRLLAQLCDKGGGGDGGGAAADLMADMEDIDDVGAGAGAGAGAGVGVAAEAAFDENVVRQLYGNGGGGGRAEGAPMGREAQLAARNVLLRLRSQHSQQLRWLRKNCKHLRDVPRIRRVWRRHAMDDFERAWNANGQISENARTIIAAFREDLLHEPVIAKPHRKTDADLSVFGNYIARLIMMFEKNLYVSTLQKELLILILSRDDCYRHDYGIHLNAMMTGDAAVGKSFLLNQLRKLSIPGTVEMVTHATQMADMGSRDMDDSMVVYEEMLLEQLGADVKNNGGGAETGDPRQKARLTEMRQTIKRFLYDEERQERTNKIEYSSQISSAAGALNESLATVPKAMLDRYLHITCPERWREGRNAWDMGNLMGDSGGGGGQSETMRAMLREFFQRQYLQIAVEKLIMVELVHDVDLRPAYPIFSEALKSMGRSGVDVTSVRSRQRMNFVARILTIHDAIQKLFFLYTSPHRGQVYNDRQLLDIEPYLVCTEEVAVFTISLLSDQFLDNKEAPLLRKLAEQWADWSSHPDAKPNYCEAGSSKRGGDRGGRRDRDRDGGGDRRDGEGRDKAPAEANGGGGGGGVAKDYNRVRIFMDIETAAAKIPVHFSPEKNELKTSAAQNRYTLEQLCKRRVSVFQRDGHCRVRKDLPPVTMLAIDSNPEERYFDVCVALFDDVDVGPLDRAIKDTEYKFSRPGKFIHPFAYDHAHPHLFRAIIRERHETRIFKYQNPAHCSRNERLVLETRLGADGRASNVSAYDGFLRQTCDAASYAIDANLEETFWSYRCFLSGLDPEDKSSLMSLPAQVERLETEFVNQLLPNGRRRFRTICYPDALIEAEQALQAPDDADAAAEALEPDGASRSMADCFAPPEEAAERARRPPCAPRARKPTPTLLSLSDFNGNDTLCAQPYYASDGGDDEEGYSPEPEKRPPPPAAAAAPAAAPADDEDDPAVAPAGRKRKRGAVGVSSGGSELDAAEQHSPTLETLMANDTVTGYPAGGYFSHEEDDEPEAEQAAPKRRRRHRTQQGAVAAEAGAGAFSALFSGTGAAATGLGL